MLLLCVALFWNSLAAASKSQSEVRRPGCCLLPRIPTFKLSSKSARDVSGELQVCDDREIELVRRSGKGRNGVKRLKLVCNVEKGEWEQKDCDDSVSDDIQVIMDNWGGERPVDSRRYELTCRAYIAPEHLHIDFSWWVQEDGISKGIPSYGDRAAVPNGLNRYAVSSSSGSESTLVIERVSATDLTNYTCEVLVAGKTKRSESVRLLEKLCPGLSMPNSGSFAEGPVIDRSPGSVVTPVCDQQFVPAPGVVRQLTCAVWGKWAAIHPETGEMEDVNWENQRIEFCKQNVACERTPIPKAKDSPIETTNAIKQGRLVHPGTVLTYRCRNGYDLYGSPNRMCTSEGHYTHDLPQCKPQCLNQCKQLSLPNGVISFKLKKKAIIGKRPNKKIIRNTCTPTFRCNGGYRMEKQLHLVCDHVQNKWIDRSGSDSFDHPNCTFHGLSE